MTDSPVASQVAAFYERVSEAWPPQDWIQHRVLVAVSGGPDSVALLRALRHLSENQIKTSPGLAVAHIHHGLRGAEADRDHDFVEQLASTLDVSFYAQRLDGDALRTEGCDGIETAARQARYAGLLQIAHKIGARYIATGHNLDDQAETVLFRILRGSGIAGLSGIRFARPLDDGLTIVRPLLQVRRDEIELFLTAIGQAYCCDSTNVDPASASRNWIRHELLPQIRDKFGANVSTSLSQLAAIAVEYQQVVAESADELFDRAVVSFVPDRVSLDLAELRGRPPLLIQTVLHRMWTSQSWPQQDMNFDKWCSLVAWAGGTVGDSQETDFPGRIRVCRKDGLLHFTRCFVDPALPSTDRRAAP